jgi:hypothetical protein
MDPASNSYSSSEQTHFFSSPEQQLNASIQFLDNAFATSEGLEFSDDKRHSLVDQRNSQGFGRRFFEYIVPRSPEQTDRLMRSPSSTKLGMNALSESSADEKIDELKNTKKTFRRSISLPHNGKEEITRASLSKKTKAVKKLTSSEGYRSFNTQVYSDRELIQPISARVNSQKNGSSIRNLDDLTYIEKNKESNFDKKTRKLTRELLEKSKKELTNLPQVKLEKELRTIALRFFDNEINAVTRSRYELRRTTSHGLINTELPRAIEALTKLQKSMVLVKSLIPRLQFLQNSLYKILTRNAEKNPPKKCYKSPWVTNFFEGLDWLNSAYSFRKKEMNPLKTFSVIYGQSLQNDKMNELIVLCLAIEQVEFDKIISCLNEWADSTNATKLRDRVGIIDRENIKKSLDLDLNRITKQRHVWIESLDCPISLSKNRVDEIVRCLIPEDSVLYKEITVNDKIIELKDFSGNKSACKKEFFKKLIYAICLGGFDLTVKEEMCENQAKVLVHIRELCSSIYENLVLDTIPWETVQKKMAEYPAIPFMRFKKRFAKDSLENLDQFIIDLTIPCINILRLCTNDCWSLADECIRCLYPKLFLPYGENSRGFKFQTQAESGIYCHINIKNNKHFDVTQIKRYATYPSTSNSINSNGINTKLKQARSLFKWTLSPYEDHTSQITCWRGLLEIPDVEICSRTNPDNRAKILRILNNPVLVDYVMNSLNDKPKILTTYL